MFPRVVASYNRTYWLIKQALVAVVLIGLSDLEYLYLPRIVIIIRHRVIALEFYSPVSVNKWIKIMCVL